MHPKPKSQKRVKKKIYLTSKLLRVKSFLRGNKFKTMSLFHERTFIGNNGYLNGKDDHIYYILQIF